MKLYRRQLVASTYQCPLRAPSRPSLRCPSMSAYKKFRCKTRQLSPKLSPKGEKALRVERVKFDKRMFLFNFSGARGRNRTTDTRIFNQSGLTHIPPQAASSSHINFLAWLGLRRAGRHIPPHPATPNHTDVCHPYATQARKRSFTEAAANDCSEPKPTKCCTTLELGPGNF